MLCCCCTAFQKEEENSRLDLRRWRGEDLGRRKGRADRIASTPPSRVAHQKKLMATYTVETFKCHFLSSWKRRKDNNWLPFFFTLFFLDSPRSNSKRLTGTPTSQPSGKIKSIQENLFGREWEADRFKFFSDITTPKIELRSVAFLLFVYNVTGSLSASRSAEFQMDPAVYFSLMIEDT